MNMFYTIQSLHNGTVFAVIDSNGDTVGFGKTLEIAERIKAKAEKAAAESAALADAIGKTFNLW